MRSTWNAARGETGFGLVTSRVVESPPHVRVPLLAIVGGLEEPKFPTSRIYELRGRAYLHPHTFIAGVGLCPLGGPGRKCQAGENRKISTRKWQADIIKRFEIIKRLPNVFAEKRSLHKHIWTTSYSSFYTDECVSRGEKCNVRKSGGRRQCRNLPSHCRLPCWQQKAHEQDDNSRSWHFCGEASPWVFTVLFTTLQNTTHSQKPNYKRFQLSTEFNFNRWKRVDHIRMKIERKRIIIVNLLAMSWNVHNWQTWSLDRLLGSNFLSGIIITEKCLSNFAPSHYWPSIDTLFDAFHKTATRFINTFTFIL